MENHERFALITGGAQGIGLATADRFLADGFAGVALLDRNGALLGQAAEEVSARFRRPVISIVGDLADATLPATAMARVERDFGRLDVLVNAAGSTDRCGLDDTDAQAFDRIFAVNTRAPLLLMREAVKLMRPRRSGVIINVASMLAHGGPPNLLTYSASKAALCTLTKSAANTVKRDGIRIFAINLGWVRTEGEHMTQTVVHGLPENWADTVGARMPSGRLIAANDVAGLMAFLVSPPATMMTGAIIDYEQMPVGTFDSHPALAPE